MRRDFLSVAAMGMVLVVLSGCNGPAKSDANPARTRPIDTVREEIVAVKTQVEATVAAAQAVVVQPGPDARTLRRRLATEVANMEARVQSLRTNAQELNERATEYLMVWGGEVNYIGAQGAPQTGVNTPRQQAKARYDRMVSSLLSARDALSPFQSSLETLQERLTDRLPAAQLQALRPDVQQVEAYGRTLRSHLQDALNALDELKANAPNAAPQ